MAENGVEQSASTKSISTTRTRDVGLITPIGQDKDGNFIYKPEDQAVIDEITSSGGCVNVKKGIITLVPCEEEGKRGTLSKFTGSRRVSTWSIQEKVYTEYKTRTCIFATVVAIVIALIVVVAVVVASQSGGEGSNKRRKTGLGGSNSRPSLSPSPASSELNFCGLDFADATRTCAIPCRLGKDFECPADQRCFSNVKTCATLEGPTTSTSNYCGFSFDDASKNCFQECPNGVNTECLTPGHTCFSNVESCKAENPDDTASGSSDTSNFCGFSFDDASINCAEECPSGLSRECSTEGHGCFANVASCRPSPTPSPSFLFFGNSPSPTKSSVFSRSPTPNFAWSPSPIQSGLFFGQSPAPSFIRFSSPSPPTPSPNRFLPSPPAYPTSP